MQISRSICFNICNSTGINLQRGQQPRLMSRIEQVANILEKRISSLNAAPSQRRDEIAGEGTSQRLLKSASLGNLAPGSWALAKECQKKLIAVAFGCGLTSVSWAEKSKHPFSTWQASQSSTSCFQEREGRIIVSMMVMLTFL